jgi:hypothetical protein
MCFDERPERTGALQSLDILLVHLYSEGDKLDALVLRQFVAPDLLLTNREGANAIIHLSDPLIKRIAGVVVRIDPISRQNVHDKQSVAGSARTP